MVFLLRPGIDIAEAYRRLCRNLCYTEILVKHPCFADREAQIIILAYIFIIVMFPDINTEDFQAARIPSVDKLEHFFGKIKNKMEV